MFMNMAATNTVLTAIFWLTARTGKANFTNNYKSTEGPPVPARRALMQITPLATGGGRGRSWRAGTTR
jgi:hypothetical protein